ncbi:hypothetical protein F4810DRAFT_671190, partial [Camillea tinctor]
MALRTRVDFLKRGQEPPRRDWSCLIMGVTTVSGKLAVRVSRAMGVMRVVGAARSEEAKELGLDGYITLKNPAVETDFSPAAGVDVVLDYPYDPYVAAYLVTPSATKPLTWVQIGSLAGPSAEIPAACLRKQDVTVRESGAGAWDIRELGMEIGDILGMMKGIRMDELMVVDMRDAEREWNMEGRVVFVNQEKSALH